MAVTGGGVLITYKSAMAKSAAERVTRVGVGIYEARADLMEFVLGVRKSEILYTLQQHCVEKGRRVYNNYTCICGEVHSALDADDYDDDDDSKGSAVEASVFVSF